MKRFALGLVALCLAAAPALADTLANWTFESSVPATAGPHAAEVGAGLALGFHASSSAVYSNPAGNGSAESFSSNFWSAGDYYEFQVDTTGFESITFGWDQNSSSTGPDSFALQYSTDGVNFTTVLDYAPTKISWSSVTYNAASTFGPVALPAAADDQATLYVRLTSNVTPANTGGTNRVDNVIVEGVVIPEPASIGLLIAGGLALIRRR